MNAFLVFLVAVVFAGVLWLALHRQWRRQSLPCYVFRDEWVQDPAKPWWQR